MNNSKFIKVIGEDKKEKFTDCSLSSETEGRIISVNKKFIAMSWQNSGEIVVVDSSLPSQIKIDQPKIKGPKGKILDLEFSPFNKNILASTNDNFSIFIWKIPEEGIAKDIKKEEQIYNGHSKKVNFVSFNPVAEDVICSGACPREIHVWNITKGENYIKMKADNNPSSISWNPNGSLIGASTCNRYMNIFDPRSKKKLLGMK